MFARNYAFRNTPRAFRDALLAELVVLTVAPGSDAVRAGDVIDGWYVVVAGLARAFADGAETPSILAAGDGFGETGLLEPVQSSVTVQAEGVLTLALLPRRSSDAVAAAHPDAAAAFRARLARQSDFDFLRRMRVFAHLGPQDTEALFDQLERITLAPGERLYGENEPGASGYIVRRGRLRLVTTVSQSRRQLATRREGDLVGEIELLYGTPRMADAIADSECELFSFSRELFDRLTPTDRDRHALYQLATDRLLQYQNALSDSDARGQQAEVPSLDVTWESVPGLRPRGSFPLVKTNVPEAAGLACLAMIDALGNRRGGWQDRVDQLLWERQPDTLLTLCRKAEQCGYLTHVFNASVETLGQTALPAVIEDNDGSLAVLAAGPSRQYVIANPRSGVRTVDAPTLAQGWNGRMITLTPRTRRWSRTALAEYGPVFAAIAVVSLLTQGFGIGGPLAGRWLVDRVLVDGDASLWRLLLLGIMVMLVAHVTAGALREYLTAHTCGRITLNLQLRFFDHILRLPAGTTAAFQAGDLAVRFREIETFVRAAFKAGMFLVVDAIGLVMHLAVLAALSLPLAAIALAFAAANTALWLASASAVRKTGSRHLEAHRAFRSHLMETVGGIHTIKALVLEPFFVARGNTLMGRRKADQFRGAEMVAVIDLVRRALHAAAVVALLGYGATLTLRGDATTGGLFASVGVFGALLIPLNGVLQARDAIAEARASWANLSTVLDLETEDAGNTTVAPVLSGHVELKRVSFRYPGATEDALTDITLEVLPGQKVALVGRSGSGKTTLFNLLLGLYRPDQGTIALDQIEIGSIPKSALRRQIGVVEQHPFLFDTSIRENITGSDPSVTDAEMEAAARMAGAHAFITALPGGYAARLGDPGITLSGGERQRLVIARALVGNPRMLLLDEATSAIDSRLERAIHAQIDNLPGTRTTFVIAHRLSTVRDADLIVVLDQGRIVETGTHPDLMARRGLYCYLHTRFA